MLRSMIAVTVFGLVLVVTPGISSEAGSGLERADGLSKAERFGLALEVCERAHAAGIPGKCQLYGKIKVVKHHEDVTVKRVKHHEDIRVKWVEHFSDEPGRWERAEHHEDYKVKFVEHHEDYKVRFVEHHEGCD